MWGRSWWRECASLSSVKIVQIRMHDMFEDLQGRCAAHAGFGLAECHNASLLRVCGSDLRMLKVGRIMVEGLCGGVGCENSASTRA